jgi:hypothetical protein
MGPLESVPSLSFKIRAFCADRDLRTVFLTGLIVFEGSTNSMNILAAKSIITVPAEKRFGKGAAETPDGSI